MEPWIIIPLALAAATVGMFAAYALVFLTVRWPNVLACYWACRRERPDKLQRYKIIIHAGLYTTFIASFGGVYLYSSEIFTIVVRTAGIAGGSVLAFGILSEWLVPQLTGLRLVRPPKFLLRAFGPDDWSGPCWIRLFAYLVWALILASLVAATIIGVLSAAGGALIIALLGKSMRNREDAWAEAEKQRAVEVADRMQKTAENAFFERIGDRIPDRTTSADTPAATHFLQEGLHDRNPEVRKAAAKALAETPDVNATEALVAALKRKDGPYEMSADAERALTNIGVPALEPLLDLLGNRSNLLAFRAACRIFGRLSDSRAVDHLIPALKDSTRSVRVEAAKALGAIGIARALEALFSALRHRNDLIAEPAALALGGLADPRAVEPLVAALGHDSNEVVLRAAYALGQIGKPAIEAVAAAAGTGKIQKRLQAIEALTQIGQCAAGKLAEIWKCDAELRLRAGTALIKLDPQTALVQFTESLNGTETEVRVASVSMLGELENPVTTGLLISALGDKDPAVRRRAVHSLAQHKHSEKAWQALIDALGAEDPSVRATAAHGLGGFPPMDAAQKKFVYALLVEKLKDEEEPVRAGAAAALGAIGDPAAIEPIKAARSTISWLNRYYVDEALARLGEKAGG